MNDKVLFQETAQKLIDFDEIHREEYLRGEYYVEFCPKAFYLEHKIFIIVSVLIHLFCVFMHVELMGVDPWLIIIFIFMYRSHRKKIRKREDVLQRREELINDEKRAGYIQLLDSLAEKHSEWGVEPWWNVISGMDLGKGEFRMYDMDYFALPLVDVDTRKRKYLEEGGMINITSNDEVKKLIQSGEYYRLTIRADNYDIPNEYRMAALCFHTSSEIKESYNRPTYSSSDIEEHMNSYTNNLNRREAEKNFWLNSGNYETNDEKHSRRQLEWGRYANADFNEMVDDWFERKRKEEKYRNKLENETEHVSYVSGYEQSFYHVGWMISDKSGVIVEILINKQYAYCAKFATQSQELGKRCFVKFQYKLAKENEKVKISRYEIISRLYAFRFRAMDYTSKRPQHLTLKEWAAWIYAHSDDRYLSEYNQ